MSEIERMSPDLMPLTSSIPVYLTHTHCNISDDEPRDLSTKKKSRPVPPPLDLSKRNLDPPSEKSPRSPLAQKNLPLRKRAYSWSSQPEIFNLQLKQGQTQGLMRNALETSELNPNNTATFSSTTYSSNSLKFSGLPTPHTPHTPHPHSAIPVITSRFNFGENLNAPINESSSRMTYCNQGPLNLSTAVGTLPSSLLSPAPSHPSSSSLNSSREELEPDPMLVSECQMISPSQISPQLPHTLNSQRVSVMEHSGEIAASNSPSGTSYVAPCQNTSHQWPTSVWSIFLAGVRIHFFLGEGQITRARFSEDLGVLEHHHQQQYAPHGLHLLRIIYEDNNQYDVSSSNPAQFCKLFFRPVGIQHQDIMVIAPPDHPYYVHGKGWCSLLVDQASDRYNIPCQQLQEGDVCLPPYHPETTRTPIPNVTPDLTDAMKRFDFNEENYEVTYSSSGSAPPSATFPLQQTHRSVFLSPPASPSKKSGSKDPNGSPLSLAETGGGGGAAVPGSGGGMGSGTGSKSRRPMNGFMLFAKHHRLKLIQHHPGKDNRAISVLLGGMWRSLPDEDRERYNNEARVQAEERKRIDPDCWKRKRSHSTS